MTSVRLFDPPEDFGLGVIVGPSGSGKSTLLRSLFGEPQAHDWDAGKAIVSHFGTPEAAIEKLTAVGLNTVPSWVRPYQVLSTGERFRADLARSLKDGACVDEYSSVVDRNVAKAASCAVSKYISRAGLKRVVLATCHHDVIDWLQPDWVYDTNLEEILPRGSLCQRPEIVVQIVPAARSLWRVFAPHHYLSGSLNESAKCYAAVWNDELVGFYATLVFPHASLGAASRAHRFVILPDFQGLGIGTRFQDSIAQLNLDQGRRFYIRVSHPGLIRYCRRSSLWRFCYDGAKAVEHAGTVGGWSMRPDRYAATFEYVGKSGKAVL